MELGVGYQLLGHGVDSFIYCSSKDCTSCNVSCTLRFCLTSVCVCVCVCESLALFSTHLPTRSCYCCGKNNWSESLAEQEEFFIHVTRQTFCPPAAHSQRDVYQRAVVEKRVRDVVLMRCNFLLYKSRASQKHTEIRPQHLARKHTLTCQFIQCTELKRMQSNATVLQ